MIYVKIHNTQNGNILAMCDEEQIGKVLKDGDVVINIKDYSEFYKGELINEKQWKWYGTVIYSANIIGKRSIDLAIKSNIIKKENVRHAAGVPYAHAYLVD
ncbi:MAG: DUF424 family protein [Candidatus Micrarchaeaceae archaeon]